jgi:pyridoxine 4-dehydrogenase
MFARSWKPARSALLCKAAFRVSYELPSVSRIAVGTNRVDHLRDLLTALRLRADKNQIVAYRKLLRAKTATVTK